MGSRHRITGFAFSAIAIGMASASIAAAADVGIVNANNVRHAGDIDNPGNDLITVTYNGPATIMTQFDLDGTLRANNAATFASETQFVVANITQGYGFFFETNAFDDEFVTLDFDQVTGPAFFFVQPGDEFAFLAVDDFDDGAGPDETWDTLSLVFSDNRPFTQLGSFDPGIVSINAATIADEAGLGIYRADGQLVGSGEMGVDTPMNVLLEPGTYYMVVSGEGAQFGDMFATTSPFDQHVIASPFAITFDGAPIVNDAFSGQRPSFMYEFTVVPEPTTMLLTLCGAVGLVRRRCIRN